MIGSKSTILKYTANEVKEIIKGDRAKVRMESRKLHKQHQVIYNSYKKKLEVLLDEEREKVKCSVAKEEQLLAEKKQQTTNILYERELKFNQINSSISTREADINFLKEERIFLLDEMAKGHNLFEMGDIKLTSIFENCDKEKAESEKVQNEFEELETSHQKFHERYQELHRSVLASRDRVASLSHKLEQADNLCAEADKKFSRLIEKAFQKSNSANKMHTELSKKNQESYVVLNVHLKKKQLELQQVKMEIKKYDSENENLETISNELMAALSKKE